MPSTDHMDNGLHTYRLHGCWVPDPMPTDRMGTGPHAHGLHGDWVLDPMSYRPHGGDMI